MGMKGTQQKTAPVFEVRETRLCGELGMSKDELRRRRQYFLVEGQHWGIVDKRVLLSRIGAEILRGTRTAAVPAREGATADCEPKKRGPIALLEEKNPPPARFEGKLVAWAMPSHNRRIVVCYLPGTDPEVSLNLVVLMVRDNGNFMRGMVIPDTRPPGNQVVVRKVPEREDKFELQGQCPRWKGRW